ncbi:hypothetical protein [Nocardioides sp. YIM 152588]|uniref:trypsin-like serine peptidase n=1 Tax=Nocardioides sp. YIM 152588 TaxID=3158259 RepID=UPI0032E3E221
MNSVTRSIRGRCRRSLLGALGLCCGIGLAVAPVDPHAAGATGAGTRTDDGAVLSRTVERGWPTVRAAWTRKRMAAAIPLDLTVGGSAVGTPTPADSRAVARQADAVPTGPKARVPRSVGKLFFSDGDLDYVCSAAAIRSPRRNLILTAGHCVHTGPNPSGIPVIGSLIDQPRFFSDWVFVPRYRNGRKPFGKWRARTAYVTRGWAENESFARDQAVIKLRKRAGKKLVDVVGGNEVRLGVRPAKKRTRIWGWPAAAPYQGRRAWRCDGRTKRINSAGANRDASLRCTMTGGSSGGPWMLKRRGAKRGPIWAVTSRSVSAKPRLIAHPLGRVVRKMVRAANP